MRKVAKATLFWTMRFIKKSSLSFKTFCEPDRTVLLHQKLRWHCQSQGSYPLIPNSDTRKKRNKAVYLCNFENKTIEFQVSKILVIFE